jgi:hypothetical protein
MLGNLKEKAKEKALEKFKSEIIPAVEAKIELFQDLKPADINDDEKYKTVIVTPLWKVAKMQSGGAISVAQKFVDVEAKFRDGLFNVRDELVRVQDEKIFLDPKFNDKIVSVLSQSISG